MLKLRQNTQVPKFLNCDTHLEPELNFYLHTEKPRFLVEVTTNFPSDKIKFLEANDFLYRTVNVKAACSNDLLVIIDSYDDEYLGTLTDQESYDLLSSILDKMAEWHISETTDLQNYL